MPSSPAAKGKAKSAITRTVIETMRRMMQSIAKPTMRSPALATWNGTEIPSGVAIERTRAELTAACILLSHCEGAVGRQGAQHGSRTSVHGQKLLLGRMDNGC